MFIRILQIWSFVLAFLVLVGGVLALIYLFIEHVLLPPARLRMAAGPEGGGYNTLALRYKAVLLALDGLKLDLVENAGGAENAQLLSEGEVDVALFKGAFCRP